VPVEIRYRSKKTFITGDISEKTNVARYYVTFPLSSAALVQANRSPYNDPAAALARQRPNLQPSAATPYA
jgi:hypothetical protein